MFGCRETLGSVDKYTLLHRRIVEMILKGFDTSNCNDKINGLVRRFISNEPGTTPLYSEETQ